MSNNYIKRFSRVVNIFRNKIHNGAIKLKRDTTLDIRCNYCNIHYKILDYNNSYSEIYCDKCGKILKI